MHPFGSTPSCHDDHPFEPLRRKSVGHRCSSSGSCERRGARRLPASRLDLGHHDAPYQAVSPLPLSDIVKVTSKGCSKTSYLRSSVYSMKARQMSISAVRANFDRVFEQVKRGRTILVLRRRRPIAILEKPIVSNARQRVIRRPRRSARHRTQRH